MTDPDTTDTGTLGPAPNGTTATGNGGTAVDPGTTGAAGSDTGTRELAATDAQAAARQAWLDSGGTLTGAKLGDLFGMSERWGRKQIAAARNGTNGTHGTTARNGTKDRAGTTPNGTPPGRTGRTAGTVPAAGSAPRPARDRHSGTGRPAVAHTKPGTVPPLLLAVTVAAVGLVTAVCAVVSYVHVRDLARLAGMGSLAGWLPLGVDGLVVACSCSLIVDRHHGRPGHPVAWLGVVLGLATTLTANVVAVDPGLVPLRAVRWVLAGYAPAALGVSGHLLFRMLGEGDKQ